MRKRYQHDDFVALCSELVGTLLRLRQKRRSRGAGGIRNSALLEAYPGWREELRIYIPEEHDALATELLKRATDEKMTGLATEGVEVRRYLVKSGGEWRSALQLLADGEIPPTKLSATERCKGPCLVYLRDGVDVSRPCSEAELSIAGRWSFPALSRWRAGCASVIQ